MKLTNKTLDFWENMFPRLEYEAREILKKWLVGQGRSEQDYIFYSMKLEDGFPIKILANTACHCHPEYKTVLEITKQDIMDNQNEDVK
jgi:DNA polymerase III delta prime subunit